MIISFIIYKYRIVNTIYWNIMRIKRDIFIIYARYTVWRIKYLYVNFFRKEQNAFQCESLCAYKYADESSK